MPDRPEFDGIDAELIGRYLSKRDVGGRDDAGAPLADGAPRGGGAAEAVPRAPGRRGRSSARAGRRRRVECAAGAHPRARGRRSIASSAPRTTPTAPVHAVPRRACWRRAGALAAAASIVLAAGLTTARSPIAFPRRGRRPRTGTRTSPAPASAPICCSPTARACGSRRVVRCASRRTSARPVATCTSTAKATSR